MPPQIPSIQSFFQPEVPTTRKTQKPSSHHSPPDTSDGFTTSEIEAALHPSLHKWQPRTAYTSTSIGNLVAGPGCIKLTGRVVNYHDIATPSKMPHAATGCLKLIVKDDTGAFTVSSTRSHQSSSFALSRLPCSRSQIDGPAQVKLWYAKVTYNLYLSALVSIWTPHVSAAECSSLTTVPDAALVTSIFPERDISCYFMVQEESDEGVVCKTPIGYRDGRQLDGLMTLKGFVEGGHEVEGGKILVCVKSMGGRKKCERLPFLLLAVRGGCVE